MLASLHSEEANVGNPICVSLIRIHTYTYVRMYESESGNGSEYKFTSQLTLISNLPTYMVYSVRGQGTNLCANNGLWFYLQVQFRCPDLCMMVINIYRSARRFSFPPA